jgi:chromate transporter
VAAAPGLRAIAGEWGRIGCVGFGGPPAHIALLRALCVERRGWLSDEEFQDGVAATNVLPGPASTQLAIYCAWRMRGNAGALVGGVAFIAPGLALIVALAALFLASSPPAWVLGAGAGAGSAVAAVAVRAGADLVPGSIGRASGRGRTRWGAYALAGALAAILAGPWLVLVLLACGAVEIAVRRRDCGAHGLAAAGWPLGVLASLPAGGALLPLAWTALKVGALSYGGGFVIIPLMRADAVDARGWMTDAQFLNAVALGQVTPGPVVHTVAVVGFAAAGLAGALLAALVAFAPSFGFVLIGAERFDRLRADPRVRAFLDGAGPAAIGAIVGIAIPLALALQAPWQYAVLGGASVALLALRRGVVPTLVCAGAAGAGLALLGVQPPA